MILAWLNFRSGKYEYRECPATDEEAVQYISQSPSAQALYRVRRELGDSVLQSMETVLRACVGESEAADAA